MKDITRIHIAKVPYSIELTAKKNLKKYIEELELYTGDHDVIDDIEIRITELLEERGIKKDDVISDEDITAIRQLLGEPKDFMTDDATLDVNAEIIEKQGQRKLYRNLETAVIGGVLSGIATFFKINPLWVRLAFVFLTFVSAGLSVLFYAVLWLIVPPARTAAEKLQAAGRPVTLSSIREINENGSGVDIERRIRIQKRVATTTLGSLSIIGALLVIALLVFVFGITPFGDEYARIVQQYQAALIFGAVAAVLLLALFLLVAFASFAQKFNKRIWISGIVIIVLGLGSFGASVALTSYQHDQQYQEVLRNTVDTSVKVPENYASITSLSVDAPNTTSVVYIVDDSITSIKQRALKDTPKVSAVVQNGELKIKLAKPEYFNPIADSTITLYGPRLSSIIMSNGNASYSGASQEKLKVEVYNQSSLSLVESRVDSLDVKTDGLGRFSGTEAAVSSVQASVYGQSTVELGNIKSLDVTNPDVCASHATAKLSVQNIVSASYKHNGIETGAKSIENPCLEIQFGPEDYGSYNYQD